MAKFAPTAQQQDFLDALTSTTDHLALVARAGCGKTSTILMGVDRIVATVPNPEILVCAFNKAIADEVSAKLKEEGHTDWRKVQASTLHALGYGLLRFALRLGRDAIDDHKVRNIIREMAAYGSNSVPEDMRFALEVYGTQVESLVRYAKQSGVGFFNDLPINSVDVWHALADRYDVNGFDDTSEAGIVVEAAQEVYRRSLNKLDVIDFDDMILLPLIKNIRVKYTKTHIFLDEAQDLSRSRQALARKFLRVHTGRMIIVGDDRQAIYGFTGADAEALPNLIQSFNAKVMPLSVTWRCPKAVVQRANAYVADIVAADAAPEGYVGHIEALPEDMAVGDAVLCRNTAPLITTAYSLIRAGKPCKVEGRAIGEGLKKLAMRWKVSTIDALLNRIDTYQDRETQKALAKDNEAKVEEIEDRCETIRQICQACTLSGKKLVTDVVAFIDQLFADGDEKSIILATYHRSKGREWNRVFLWEHSSRCPSKMAKQEWQLVQEDNLAYVAVTRAKQALYFVR